MDDVERISLMEPLHISVEPLNLYFWVSGRVVAHFNYDHSGRGNIAIEQKIISIELDGVRDARRKFIPLLLAEAANEDTAYELHRILLLLRS